MIVFQITNIIYYRMKGWFLQMNLRKSIEDVVISLIENNTAGCISRYEVVPTDGNGFLVYDTEGNSLKVVSEESIYSNLSTNESTFTKLVNLLVEKGYKEVSI